MRDHDGKCTISYIFFFFPRPDLKLIRAVLLFIAREISRGSFFNLHLYCINLTIKISRRKILYSHIQGQKNKHTKKKKKLGEKNKIKQEKKYMYVTRK